MRGKMNSSSQMDIDEQRLELTQPARVEESEGLSGPNGAIRLEGRSLVHLMPPPAPPNSGVVDCRAIRRPEGDRHIGLNAIAAVSVSAQVACSGGDASQVYPSQLRIEALQLEQSRAGSETTTPRTLTQSNINSELQAEFYAWLSNRQGGSEFTPQSRKSGFTPNQLARGNEISESTQRQRSATLAQRRDAPRIGEGS